MEFSHLAPNGPTLLTPKLFGDGRGYFMETFRQNDFDRHCGRHEFVQDNQSSSRQYVLRGMHYQLKRPQGKLVRVIRGKVMDVAVDLRRSSANFGKFYSVVLDENNRQALWVPPGFAHGFLVLSAEAEFVYKCTTYYAPEDEHSLLWNDPAVGIDWGLRGKEPILSEKDRNARPLAECPVYE